MKPFTEWTVLPHGKLTRLDDNLATVTGVMHMPPMGEVSRRMTVARLADGRLVVYSAIALNEAEMSALERFGRPAFLIVPSDIHRMDAKPWSDRYPSMIVVAPAGARKKVEDVVHVDMTDVDFGDHSVRFVSVPGTANREAALVVESLGKTTLVLNDLIFDLANRSGFKGWLFKTIGMTGDEPHLPGPVKMHSVVDERALREQLRAWAALPSLRRVIVSHGGIIAENPAGVLERVASKLAA